MLCWCELSGCPLRVWVTCRLGGSILKMASSKALPHARVTCAQTTCHRSTFMRACICTPTAFQCTLSATHTYEDEFALMLCAILRTPSACSAPYLGRKRWRILSAAVGLSFGSTSCAALRLRLRLAAAGITKDANGFEPRKAGFGLRAFPGVISWVKKCAAQRQARDCLFVRSMPSAYRRWHRFRHRCWHDAAPRCEFCCIAQAADSGAGLT